MTLRARLTLVAAGVVAVVVALACVDDVLPDAARALVAARRVAAQPGGDDPEQPERGLQGVDDFGGNLVDVIDDTGTCT